MDNHEISAIWLTAELGPVPKSNILNVKNDLKSIALTAVSAIIMKCFERIVLNYLSPEKLVDKLQFA